MEKSFHRNNHYVPQLYLKQWATADRRIRTYRTLVPDSRMPLWGDHSLRGVAFHAHLYTQRIAGQEADNVERWLDKEFEAPAEEAIFKAVSGKRLTEGDWGKIVRFLAAQDVRTPARLAEALKRWEKDLPAFLERTMKRTIKRLEEVKASGKNPPQPRLSDRGAFPMRVTTEIRPGQDMGAIKAEIVAGRALWLSYMPHLLTKTAKVLHQHRWTILSPPEDLSWFTSDDPVIRLNYYGRGRYDLLGGWNNKGTEILLPLGPQHLLYTKVGERPSRRGEIVTLPQATWIRRFIAEHANRMIFASEPDPEIPYMRRRLVDAQLHRDEKEHWQKWPDEQAAAERKIMDQSGITVTPAEVEKVVASGLLDKLDTDLLERYPGEPVNGIDPAEFRAAGGYFVIASCNSQLAGCGAFRPLDAETVEIKRMYVEPRFRGFGVARAVLEAVEAEARRRGYVLSILETGQRMTQAIALYRSCGYVDIEPFGIYVGSARSVCLGKPL